MNRVPSLDGLRSFSVALVIYSHLGLTGRLPRLPADFGRLGVETFFVISGFIITKLLLDERESTGAISLKAFYKRRFFRIIPAAYLYVLVAFLLRGAQFRALDIVESLTLTTNHDFGGPVLVGHFWSLGVEEQFYILWPVTLVLFFRHRVKILAISLCLAPFIVIVCRHYWGRRLDGVFPTTYDCLAMGCLGAVFRDKLSWLRSRWCLLALPVAIAGSWPLWRLPFVGGGHVFWTLERLAIAIFVLHTTNHRYFFLNLRSITWVGQISYGLYLWQQMFVYLPATIAILATLGTATASYYLMERPILHWRRRAALAKQPPDQRAAAFS